MIGAEDPAGMVLDAGSVLLDDAAGLASVDLDSDEVTTAVKPEPEFFLSLK